MADTAKRLYGPAQLAASATTVYTVPASTTAILRFLHVNNTSGSDRTFTLSVGADAASTRLWALTVPAGSTLDWTGFIPLATGETVQAYASAATSLTLVLAGVEVA